MPTPFAIPANLVSHNLIIPHLSAHARDIIVDCAPLSTNAASAWLLTFIGTYNIVTLANVSGLYSTAISIFSWIFCCRISSSKNCCASTSNGSFCARNIISCFLLSRSIRSRRCFSCSRNNCANSSDVGC